MSKEQRDRGIKGENKGIPIRLSKLSAYIPNIQKGKYYIVMADSGVFVAPLKLDKLLETQEIDNQQPIISLND